MRRSFFGVLGGLFVLLMSTCWVALLNGQPVFFMSDSLNYVRGADFAVVYFFGDKYATAWTQERTLRGLHNIASHTETPSEEITPINAPFEKSVVSGRSIYYGMLLYAGEITGHFWFSVFMQAAIFLYLTYTLAVTCFGLSFLPFATIAVAVLLVTPLSFFISFLMPDVFVSFLVLAVIILYEFWGRLATRDRMMTIAILVYSAITHISHLLLFGVLLLAAGTISVSRKKIFSPARVPIMLLMSLLFIAILGELAFSVGVKLTLGAYPLRPPFVMGRLIEDGPGFEFLKMNCGTESYVICDYLDRLPTDTNTFLWSKDGKRGVYSIMSLPMRIKLDAEQASFAWDVFKFDPMGVIAGAFRNFIAELRNVELGEFVFTPTRIEEFKSGLPGEYYGNLQKVGFLSHEWVLDFGDVYAAVYYSSLTLLLAFIFWPLFSAEGKLAPSRQSTWHSIAILVTVAVVSNAAICGTLSGPFARYQTRIAWLPFFVVCLFVASQWRSRRPFQAKSLKLSQYGSRL